MGLFLDGIRKYLLKCTNKIKYLEFFPIVTSPITLAEGAINAADSDTLGAIPFTATNRVDGTSRSEYFKTSIELPNLSKLCLRNSWKRRKENLSKMYAIQSLDISIYIKHSILHTPETSRKIGRSKNYLCTHRSHGSLLWRYF